MFRDRKYLDWLREQPCCILWEKTSDNEAVDPAHVGTGGRGLKAHDFEALPLMHRLHHESHNQGELSSWLRWLSVNSLALKSALQAWGVVYYLKYRLGIDACESNGNLELVEKINEMIDDR